MIEKASSTFDAPKWKQIDDRLNRAGFAKLISRLILAKSPEVPSVLAITGEWGSGKTSVANFVLEEIANQVEVVVFEPWMVGTSEALVEELFTSMGEAIFREGNREGRKRFYKYAARVTQAVSNVSGAISMVPGAPSTALGQKGITLIGKALDEAATSLSERGTLRQRRQDVSKTLERHTKSIVVLIDDVDRLNPEEIRTLFRVVKSCADFPNIKYLLLYDTKQVSQALGYGVENDGRVFLEKIIHCAFDLPVTSPNQLRAIVDEQTQIIQEDLEAGSENEKRWFEVTHQILASEAANPRMLKRITASATALSRVMRDDVGANYDPADLLLFELLRIKYPKAYNALLDLEVSAMRNDESAWLEEFSTRDDVKAGRKPKWLTLFEAALPIDEVQRLAVLRILKYLRPDRNFETGEWDSTWVRPGFFRKRYVNILWRGVYLGTSVEEVTLPESQWEILRNEIQNANWRDLVFPWETCDEGQRPFAREAFKERLSDLSSDELQGLLIECLRRYDLEPYFGSRLMSGNWLNSDALYSICESILRLSKTDAMALKWLHKAKSINQTCGGIVNLVGDEFSYHRLSSRATWCFSSRKLSRIASLWRGKLIEKVKDHSLFSLEQAPHYYDALRDLMGSEQFVILQDELNSTDEGFLLFVDRILWPRLALDRPTADAHEYLDEGDDRDSKFRRRVMNLQDPLPFGAAQCRAYYLKRKEMTADAFHQAKRLHRQLEA